MSIISIRILCFLGCSSEKVGREGSCISVFWHGDDGGGDDDDGNDGGGDDGHDYVDAFPQKYTRLLI